MLRLYRDAAGQSEITQQSPDIVKEPVLVNGTMTNVRELYVKSDDTNLTYEKIVLTAIGDEDGASQSGEVDVTYSLDGQNYVQVLDLPDGDYAESIKVYRKVVAPNVAKAFKRLDIEHQLSFDEYVK